MSEPQSGLSDPGRAMTGLGSLTLGMEAIVLLLAIAPLRMLQDNGISPAQVTVLVAGAIAAIAIAGLLRYHWGWWLGGALQVALIGCGLLHWTIAAIGVIFGLVWAYVLYVRSRVSPYRPG